MMTILWIYTPEIFHKEWMTVICLATMNVFLRVAHMLYISGFPVVRRGIKPSLYLKLKGTHHNKKKKNPARDLRNFPTEKNMSSTKTRLFHTWVPNDLQETLPEDVDSDIKQAGPLNLESDLESLRSVSLVQNENDLFFLIYGAGIIEELLRQAAHAWLCDHHLPGAIGEAYVNYLT